MCLVWVRRVDGHEEVLRDLRPGQVGGKQSEHFQLPVAQPVVSGRRVGHPRRLWLLVVLRDARELEGVFGAG